jgi:signal transduction histidine kinase
VLETGISDRGGKETAAAASMAEAVRAFDWSQTALGPAETWPQSLRSALSICLNMPTVAALYWGSDFTVIYNDAYAPALAERHPAALGRPLSEVWLEIWDVLGPQMAHVVQTGEAFAITNQPLTMHRMGRDEQTFWSYSFTPVRGEDEALVGVFVAATETTAVVQASERMSLLVERQKRLFTKAPGFIAILEGPEHRFEFVNETYNQLFGVRILGPVRDVFPELKGQGFFELLDQVYRSGQRYVAQGAPVRVEPQDGSVPRTVLVDFIYEPIRDEQDQVTGIFCQGYDVTERVLAERERDAAIQELRLADKNKDDFLSKLAHEIRNPLAPIKFGVQALRRMTVQPESRQQRLLETIERQADAITSLVEDLMDVSQVRLGKVTLVTEKVALQDVVTQAVEACSPSADGNSQEVTLDMPAYPVYVHADRKRMVQVCCNLIANAVKFTGAGGQIHLSLSQSESSARVAVRDTGIGMSAETTQKVFGLFEQGPALERSGPVGLGIGLSLVKQLIELHGGTVTAHSPGLGLGSTFEFRLPKAPS